MTTPTENFHGVTPRSFIAGGTISKGQFVKLDSTVSQVVRSTAIADLVIGVALHDATAGQQVAVQSHGVALCLVGTGGVTMGSGVMSLGSGTGEATVQTGATSQGCGIALETRLVNEFAAVFLTLPAGFRPTSA